jgi:cytochrome c553
MRKSFLTVLTAVLLLVACGETEQKAGETSKSATSEVADAKPMALMMRAIYEQSNAMRGKVEAGEALDSSFYRFLEFHQLEPTDSTVLVEVFYQHNEDFKKAFEDLLKASNKESYNAMLTQCVSCHEDFCPGPIKRINKLRFQES